MSDRQERDDDVDLAEGERAAFHRLLDMLHTEHQFDFREYKTVSLLRRIRARMSQVRVEGFDTYIDYLRLHSHEATALFNSILVNVTGFFRDPEAWQALRAEALPPLIAAATSTGRLRVWSAGCSTGEETFSAAIAIADALGPRVADVDVKIYATDIDEEALVAARQAVYRTDQLKDVPSDVLERHFTADGHVFRVRRELRRWCIFGRHNLAQDPPLPQISLLMCRNLLIYFKSPLQERLLSRFHYSLREAGVLFLGRSESLMARSRGFVPISQKWRLFRRSTDLSLVADLAIRQKEMMSAGETSTGPAAAADAPRLTPGSVIRALPYPVMLIGLDDSVREWNEAAGALFEIPTENAIGRQFRDLDISYRAEGLRARIEDVKRVVVSVRVDNVIFARRSGESVHVDFWISRVFDERSRSAAILVAALDNTAVARFRDEIVRLGEQHATATEELQSTNEELETTNEELQSTNEELETTNEELQSTNEELVTTVDELQAANAELAARSSEVRRLLVSHTAVLDSVGDAVVVIDPSFTVTTWNPGAERLFGIRATTAIGRDFFMLPLGSHADRARAVAKRLSNGGETDESDEIEFDVAPSEGRPERAVLRFVRLRDSEGLVQGLLVLGRARR
jgi:two-component system, chemotaxis family, CheB/CheR fusion protein